MALKFSTKSIARASASHPWRTVAVWAVALVVSIILIGVLLPRALTTQSTFSNTPESRQGALLIQDRLRGPDKDTEAVVVRSASQTTEAPAFQEYVQNLENQITALGPQYIAGVTTASESHNRALVSADGHTTIIPLVLAGSLDDANKNAGKIIDIVKAANGKDGFEAYVSGNASTGYEFEQIANKDLSRAEQQGIPIALVILVLVFGAVIAAFVPVFLALFAIVIALGITAVVGQVSPFSFFVENMITMMGLAVGIDYTLFIVSRFREERARGLAKIDAIAAAGGTAGRAVLFSGMTVVLALMGLLIIPTTIFHSLAGGAIFVVVVSVAASLTLLPAFLSLIGDGINRLRVPLIGQVQESLDGQRSGGFWDLVARTVMRHPVIGVTVVTAVLVAATVPYFSIRTGSAGVSSLPDSFQSKKGFEILAQEFHGAQVYPVNIVIDGPVNSAPVQAAIERLTTTLKSDPIFGPTQLEVDKAGDLGLLTVSMGSDPNAQVSIDAVSRLRSTYVKDAFKGTAASVYVSGQTAQNKDFYDLTSRYTPIVFAFVLGLSFLLLMVVFRSIVVPAKAIVMNLLSVGTAYGLLVLVIQKGVGASLFGFQQVPSIEAWLPLFLFAVLFGLSMDYHVFLLSRIREHYDQTGNNTESVAFGVRSTGHLITGAALIMVAVFAGFARGELVMFQQVGFGLGVAVLVDATVIRSVLVPASMKLLGKANWWLPPVLNWLPRIGIEGEPQPQPSAYAPEPTAGG